VAANERTDESPTQAIKQINNTRVLATEVVIGVDHNYITVAEDRDPNTEPAAPRGGWVYQVELREDTGRRISDHQVLGIQSQRAGLAPGGSGVSAALVAQAAFARYLNEAAR